MGALVGIEEAVEEIRKGRMVILVDDTNRENEGDLTMAAEMITPEAVNFMTKYGRGLICLSMTPEKIEALGLPMMVDNNRSRYGTAFTISIDAADGTTTGISVHDRAVTILAAVAKNACAKDLVSPGHVFPLKARSGGVLVRAGQTEGSVDLARLAGVAPAGVICQVMNEDGTMARVPDLLRMAETHGLKICSIRDLIQYRMRTERLIRRGAETRLPTTLGGEFRIVVYENDVNKLDHVALVKGNIMPHEEILVRVHAACLGGDVFGSTRCNCGSDLENAMRMVNEVGNGVILYMGQEDQCAEHSGKGHAEDHECCPRSRFMLKTDLRDYGLGAQILADLGIRKMRLITNNPTRIVGLEGYGLEVVEQIPLTDKPPYSNLHYLNAPKQRAMLP